MRTLLAAAAVAALAIGCGGAPQPSASRPAHQDPTAAAPARLTKAQACARLLADVRRNRGLPDVAALRDIADHVAAPRLAADARTAVRDIAHTGAAPLAFALLRDDCARAGVHIPAP
ncbi:MAG TPA: hypothetical protein VH641_12245 [Streptosporangiaceae bacterium]|jgi:hypothetical protein